MRRSASRVTFRFSGDASTTVLTSRPRPRPARRRRWRRRAPRRPRRARAAARRPGTPAGVWIAHSAERSSVRSTAPVGRRLLDGVGHRRGRDRAVDARLERAEAALDQLARDERPRGVVHDRHRGLRGRGQRVAHGRRARLAARAPGRARRRSPRARPRPRRSQTAPSTSRLHSISGRPAQTTNALGRSAPRRSPLPPAGTIPTTAHHARS